MQPWVLYQGFKLSTINHQSSRFDCHKQAICEKEHTDTKAVSKSLAPGNIHQQVSPDSAIVRGIRHMGEDDCDNVSKLFVNSIQHFVSYCLGRTTIH